MDKSQIAFSEKCGECMGIVFINGLILPRTPRIDPLGKLWSNIRRQHVLRFGVDTTGLFAYDEEQELIVCSFLLNFAQLDDPNFIDVGPNAYIGRFIDSFSVQAEIFENVIIRFIEDKKHGYDAYVKLVEEDDGSDEHYRKIDKFLDEFLASIGMKMSKPKRAPKGKKQP